MYQASSIAAHLDRIDAMEAKVTEERQKVISELMKLSVVERLDILDVDYDFMNEGGDMIYISGINDRHPYIGAFTDKCELYSGDLFSKDPDVIEAYRSGLNFKGNSRSAKISRKLNGTVDIDVRRKQVMFDFYLDSEEVLNEVKVYYPNAKITHHSMILW